MLLKKKNQLWGGKTNSSSIRSHVLSFIKHRNLGFKTRKPDFSHPSYSSPVFLMFEKNICRPSTPHNSKPQPHKHGLWCLKAPLWVL